MKEENITRISVCPLCGKAYSGYPAISRRDNATAICPDCGIREALTDLGLPSEEQEKIIDIIHRNSPSGDS